MALLDWFLSRKGAEYKKTKTDGNRPLSCSAASLCQHPPLVSSYCLLCRRELCSVLRADIACQARSAVLQGVEQ